MTTLRQRIEEIERWENEGGWLVQHRAALYPALVAALAKMEGALRTLRAWDMVHEPAPGVAEPCGDAPWARRELDAALRAMDEEIK